MPVGITCSPITVSKACEPCSGSALTFHHRLLAPAAQAVVLRPCAAKTIASVSIITSVSINADMHLSLLDGVIALGCTPINVGL